MAEITQAEIEAKITAIDASIKIITDALGSTGTNAASFTKYKIGDKEVDGSQKLEQLLKTRELYQKLLDELPSEKPQNVDYDVRLSGRDDTELQGDE